MKKKVYIVADGAYSDYGICAVFSSKKRAGEYQKLIKADWLEEWDMDVPKWAWQFVRVRMTRDGEVMKSEPAVGIEEGFLYWDWKESLNWSVSGNDIKRAIKVVNEKRAIILAHNLWGNEEGTRELFAPASTPAQSPVEP